jgi:hypothetical protein
MALSSFDLLGSVVATLFSAYPGGLHRLAIHNGCARLRVSLEAYSQTMAQGSVQPLPGAIDAPDPEVVVDGLPRRELMWQQAPSTTTSHEVEDRVKDLALGLA